MPRKARKYINTNYVHLILQGINKEYIFKEKEWKEQFVKILKNKIEDTDIEILAYCIMDNHVHLMVYYQNMDKLSKLMHKVNTTYAMMYNKINRRKGYVFRDRFFIQPILNEKHLYNCLVYIHKNPINAGICIKMQDYDYSSYNEYQKKKILLSDNSAKLVFGSKSKYMEKFDYIHNELKKIENVKDVIEREYSIETIINEYTNKVEGRLEDNELEFGKLLLEIRKKCGISLREMSKIFNISKDRLNKYIHRIIDTE